MSNYNKISLAQIDVDALSDYIVDKKKLVYRNDKDAEGEVDPSIVASNLAQDVEKVAGINAANIATAVDKNHRDTVQKAVSLLDNEGNEHLFGDFMTVSQGDSLCVKYLRTRQQYGDEIQNITDELYTLRQELAKGGFIEDRGEYEGYIDTFRKNAPKHISELLTIATPGEENNQLFIEDASVFNALDVYDYIVLKNAPLQKFDIRQIAKKDETRRVLILGDAVRPEVLAADDGIEVYLSQGINDEGMFKFAKEAELAMGDENHTGLSDDTYKRMLHVRKPNYGFGYSFRIPEEKQGFVTSFEICAKAYGTPGSMICYLIDARDLNNFHNPAQAESNYLTAKAAHSDDFHFFAASKPLTLSSSYGRRYIKFDFRQNDDTYPLMTQDEDEAIRYIAIIECLDCDDDNYYDIQFLQHRNSEGQLGDLELNNTTYNYIRQADGSTKKALTTDDTINATDLYYHIITRSIIEHEVDPEKEGLYSFHVHTKDVTHKACIMLRIKKEGAYVANTESNKQKFYNVEQILLQNSDPDNGIKSITELWLDQSIYKPLELRNTDLDISQPVPVIIGNNITTLAGKSETAITVNDPTIIKNNDAVYRAGYYVSLKARWTGIKNGIDFKTPYKHFVLPLTEVFKDFHTNDKTASARLIFESNLYSSEADAADYNDFIVQIYWTNHDMNTDYKEVKRSQMGAIKDLVVSFNQGY